MKYFNVLNNSQDGVNSKSDEREKYRGIIPVLLIVTLLFGCTPTQDEIFEQKLLSELILHKTDDVFFIDLRTIFGDEWRKICIPGQFQTQRDFERQTGEVVPHSNYRLSDKGYILLIFHKQNKVSSVEINASKIMNWASKGGICTTIYDPYLYFEIDRDGYKKYFLNGKEK